MRMVKKMIAGIVACSMVMSALVINASAETKTFAVGTATATATLDVTSSNL